MSISIVPYGPEHEAAVVAFNRRLLGGGVWDGHLFSEVARPVWLPPRPGVEIRNEYYLALDGEHVHGAYALKHQRFKVGATISSLGYLHHPVSEALVNRRFASVGPKLIQDALRRCSHLFVWGMGGTDQPLPRLLSALKWNLVPVRPQFRICRPLRVLRQLEPLRRSRARRALADAAAFSGLGALLYVTQYRPGAGVAVRGTTAAVETTFTEEADDLWRLAEPEYSFVAVRDRPMLEALYPAGGPFERLLVRRAGGLIGWAVVAVRQENRHATYGNLRVGVILDTFARLEDAPAVAAWATRYLGARADLILCSHAHGAWRSALRGLGYVEGPPTTAFGAAPSLHAVLGPPLATETLHLTRADGDGLAQYIGVP